MTLPVLDVGLFGELEGLGEDVLRCVVDEYRSEGRRYLQDIQQAVAEGDAQRWQRSAHALKGASSSVGALRVAHAARELEHATTVEGREDVDRLVNAFAEATAVIGQRAPDARR